MKEFLISERFRLELHWNKVVYSKDGVADFKGCYFSGPILSDISSIQPNDSIKLDFGKQYSKLVSSYYIAELSWGEINITDRRIILRDAILINKHINSVPKLRNDDYIVIDTANHEDTKHPMHINYTAYLLNVDGTLYNFRS